jgi:hypothetical protein
MSRVAGKRYLTPFSVAAVVVVALAALLRLAASRGDFWLDEIWSWVFARQAKSALDIIVNLPHDNNHILNTLFLYFLGDQHNWVVYRIPAVVAGIGTVILAGVIGRRTSRLAALTTMIATGCSYLLVLYDSEARGYGLLIFFVLLSLELTDRYVMQPSWTLALAFSLSCMLGLLSHLTFVDCYAGLGVWSVYRLALRRPGWRRLLGDLARCHSLPLAAVAALYFGYVRRILMGGGPPYSLPEVLYSTLSLAVGGPKAGGAAVAAGLLAGVLLLVALVALAYGEPDRLLFFGTALLLGPALLVLVQRPPYLMVRYFLVPVVLYLILMSRWLAQLYARGIAGKVMYAALMIGFLGGNGLHVARLLRYGRGSYSDALQYMADDTYSPVITVGGDHDFRNSMVVQFYARYLPAHKHVVYYDAAAWPPGGSEWFLIHNQAHSYVPLAAITARGTRYRLAGAYPYSELSGWNWYVYHNVAYAF